MPSSPPRIAIIGGGPAGLTLGLLLHNHGIQFTIFELRQKPTDDELAKSSGMLDLHEESGIAALKECGLYEEFLKHTGVCTEAQKISDKDGNIVYADEGEQSDRPEISRHHLTKLLLSRIPSDRIQWGHKLLFATTSAVSPPTEIELDFGPHGKQVFDLVVGSDGAWSAVRKLLTDIKPHYTGTQCITVTIREVSRKYLHLAELVGTGSFSALATRHGLMSHRAPQDSARLYLMLTIGDEHFVKTAELVDKSPVAAGERILNDDMLLGTWGPKLKELLRVACDEEARDNPGVPVDARPLYMLPVGHTWEHRAGATVIGDAAHLMCPWAGEGVNLAMWDSLLLAHAIVKARDATVEGAAAFQSALDPLIQEFEAEMWERTKERAEETVSNGKMLFGEDGAKAFADFFNSFGPPPEQE